jgi:hypothetical protein
MAVDLFVMPLWRFKAGDFSSPLERIGMKPKIVTWGGVISQLKPSIALARWRAKRDVAALKRTLTRELGVRVAWRDNGPVVYSEQCRPLEALRTFAKWLDQRERLPTFDDPPEDNFDKHPALSAKAESPLSFPQLVGHSCYTGYSLPCEFDRVVKAEPYTFFHWTLHRSVGSTPRLVDELDRVKTYVKSHELLRHLSDFNRSRVQSGFE